MLSVHAADKQRCWFNNRVAELKKNASLLEQDRELSISLLTFLVQVHQESVEDVGPLSQVT